MTAANVERAEGTAIEGSLREMPLADVLQLLELGRKSGLLRVEDARTGRGLAIVVVEGRLLRAGEATERRAIVDAVCDVLAWTSGRFSVGPLPPTAPMGGRRSGVAVDAVLLEGAHRADEWARLADRLPNAEAVPALALLPEGDALALTPEEWRIIAVADGAADVRTLGTRLQREVLAVARDVHRLLGIGVLTVARAAAVPSGTAQSSME